MKLVIVSAVLCAAAVVLAVPTEYGARQGKLKPTQFLKSYQGFVNDFYRKKDAYRMEYHVGDSARFEERTDSGEVKGTYAFVAPEGDEYEFKYEADDEGFKVEGEALPEAPEETDDVKAAREAFFEAYEKQLELADSDEDDDDDSDEYSDESDEDDDDESSEESDEDDSDEDDDDSDEEEDRLFGRRGSNRRVSNAIQRPRQKSSRTSYFTVPQQYSRRS